VSPLPSDTREHDDGAGRFEGELAPTFTSEAMMIMRHVLILSAWLIPAWITPTIAQHSTPAAPAPAAPAMPSIIWTYGPNPNGQGGQIAIPTNPATGRIDPAWAAQHLQGYYAPGMNLTLQTYENMYNQLQRSANGVGANQGS
jgi:hypothetical protein